MRLYSAPEMSATSTLMSNGVAGVFQTLAMMRHLVVEGRRSMMIRNAAISIIYLQPEKNDYLEATALFEYVRDHIRYVRDVNDVETISTAEKTLESAIGDCDDQCVLLASLAESVGIPSKFILTGYNGPDFEHVYVALFVNGEWVKCDPTENYVMGWEPPESTVYHEEF